MASLEEKYVSGLGILGEENFNGGKLGGRGIRGEIKEDGREGGREDLMKERG